MDVNTASAQPAIGELVNVGFVITVNDVDQVQLIAVKVTGKPAGFEISRIAAVRPRSKSTVQVGVLLGALEDRFPNEYEIVPIQGHTLRRGIHEWAVLVTARATHVGEHVSTGLEVTFTVNGKQYVERLPLRVKLLVRSA